MVKTTPSSIRLQRLCERVALVLIACLPFLTIFNAVSNVDWQGIELLIAGGFAGLALVFDRRVIFNLPKPLLWLLGVFAAACLLSLAVNPHKVYDLLGAPYVRLGSLGLLSCLTCGLVTRCFSSRKLIAYIYIGIISLSTLSVPYSLWKFHTLVRIAGLFSQADIMACFLGVGLVLGLKVLQTYPARKLKIVAAQILMAVLLILTQTRAVLVLVIVMYLIWFFQNYKDRSLQKTLLWITIGLAAIALAFGHFLPARLTNTNYASQSVSYRLTLQKYALGSSLSKPLLGYGPGNLADALACPKLHSAALQKTCRQGYFFNSSHNIFLDRVLAVGWLGGLAYVIFVMWAIYYGWRASPETRSLSYAALLIAGYYLTNVTSVTLELLFWILLLGCFASRASIER